MSYAPCDERISPVKRLVSLTLRGKGRFGRIDMSADHMIKAWAMKPIKTTCSKGRSRSYLLSFVAFVALGSATAFAETYYFAGANHNAPAFTDPAQWTNATGVAATQFSLDDAYVLGSSAGNQLDTPTGDVVFGGGEMQLGTRTAGTLLLYASSIHFPFLRFGPGESVMLSYGGAASLSGLQGRMDVRGRPRGGYLHHRPLPQALRHDDIHEVVGVGKKKGYLRNGTIQK